MSDWEDRLRRQRDQPCNKPLVALKLGFLFECTALAWDQSFVGLKFMPVPNSDTFTLDDGSCSSHSDGSSKSLVVYNDC